MLRFLRDVSVGMALILTGGTVAADPLPSWTDTEARTRIVNFVETVTDPLSDGYVTPSARIAVFDNDGTLWAEQPVYFQLLFAMDALQKRSETDPGIATTPALKAAVAGDLQAALAGGHTALAEIVAASHAGQTIEKFQASVADWLDRTRHPDTGLRYDQMTYQPMVELLRYLRDEEFSTYIVSGGGLDFMRVFADRAYGIPPEQVIGTSLAASYHVDENGPEIRKEPELFFFDDKEGKPVAISRHIGRRPIFAAGNSDGDFQMLEYTTAGNGPRFGMLVHHTDADREWAYDRGSPVGGLERGLDEAEARDWLIVDMARDWSRIYTAR